MLLLLQNECILAKIAQGTSVPTTLVIAKQLSLLMKKAGESFLLKNNLLVFGLLKIKNQLFELIFKYNNKAWLNKTKLFRITIYLLILF